MSSLDWPKVARVCDGGTEERELLATRMRAAHERAWAQRESVKTLLRRHFPADWERVRRCRMDEWYDYKVRDREDQPNLVILRSQCGDHPFCPACNDVATYRRGMGMVRRLGMGTPGGKRVRPQIVTIGVSPREGDTRLVQLVASDVRRFKRACYRAAETIFGAGVGVLVTYQHYGQEVPVHEHPHVHMLVNGYHLNGEGKVECTRKFEKNSENKAMLDQLAARELNRAFPEAGDSSKRAWLSSFDTNVEEPETEGGVARTCKYVAREIIDFRDLEYDARKRIVYVTPYKEQGPSVLDVPTLQRSLSLYNARYQPWSSEGGRRVFDSAYGELSDRLAGDTAKAMGARREHRDGCWCRECSNWGRLMADRIEGGAGTIDEDDGNGWSG
jgi:hypothetical protein